MINSEVLQYAAPIAAVLVALLTTLFNVYDRRRFYQTEQTRLESEFRKIFVERTNYFSNKFDYTNRILEFLSNANRSISTLEILIASKESREKQESELAIIKMQVDELIKSTVENQLLLTEPTHRAITRTLAEELFDQLTKLQKPEALNEMEAVRKMRSSIDRTKDLVRKDFEQTLDAFRD